MHLSEFAHFFSALPALHASMRDLIRLSGYWNQAHRERDATYTLATTIFGVVINDVNSFQRALSTFIEEWAEWVNSTTRHYELTNATEWYSGSVDIRDSWLLSNGKSWRIQYDQTLVFTFPESFWDVNVFARTTMAITTPTSSVTDTVRCTCDDRSI